MRLQPLTIDLAVPMVEVLADPRIYRFIGGRPPNLSELRRRYAAQIVGHSEDHAQCWLNWIVTLRDPCCAIGFVQATVQQSAATLEASIAWVISPDFQGDGLATEATGAMTNWLKARGVGQFAAYVHPDHHSSQAVAQKLGLRPTSLVQDGEIRWQLGSS